MSDGVNTTTRLLAALREIRTAGYNESDGAVWMQKVAAHAMEPDRWPHPGPQGPRAAQNGQSVKGLSLALALLRGPVTVLPGMAPRILLSEDDANALLADREELRRDAERYRWLRDGNAYIPEEENVPGGEMLDLLCDTKGEDAPYYGRS